MRGLKKVTLLVLGSVVALVGAGLIGTWSRLRQINLPMQLTHDGPLVLRGPDGMCWSCDEAPAETGDEGEGLCGRCTGLFTKRT